MTDTLLSAAAHKIRENDIVMVSFPIGERTNNPAHKLDGQQFVVKKRYRPNVSKGGDIYLYELFGAVSDKGGPHTFLTDELIRL